MREVTPFPTKDLTLTLGLFVGALLALVIVPVVVFATLAYALEWAFVK